MRAFGSVAVGCIAFHCSEALLYRTETFIYCCRTRAALEPDVRRKQPMTKPKSPPADPSPQRRKRYRSIIIIAPESEGPLLSGRTRWPSYLSHIDAQSILTKLATFTPNLDTSLKLINANAGRGWSLWASPTRLVHHLAKIDVLSTSAFLYEWNLRTNFVEFADPASAIGDLIFEMKQLAAQAIERDYSFFLRVRHKPLKED